MNCILVAFEGIIILGLLAVCVSLMWQMSKLEDSQPKRDARGRFTKKNK